MDQVRVLRECWDMPLPTKAKDSDVGYDLRANEEKVILAYGETAVICTGISLEMPDHLWARISPRSGLAAKNGIDVLAGIVDSGYRGEIKVVLANHGNAPFIVKKGDRIAQLIFHKAERPLLVGVTALSSSDRNGEGFGSTGVQ